MPVRRRDIDRERDAILVDRNMDFDPTDLLSAVDTRTLVDRTQPEASQCNRIGMELAYCAMWRKL
jgi:hypothetical protein